MRSIIRNILLLSLVTGAHAAHAQNTTAPLVVAEHLYLFDYQGTMNDLVEKQLTEALRGMDAEMVVAIDRPFNVMKLVARFPLSAQDLASTTSQFGVTIAARRPERPAHDTTLMPQD